MQCRKWKTSADAQPGMAVVEEQLPNNSREWVADCCQRDASLIAAAPELLAAAKALIMPDRRPAGWKRTAEERLRATIAAAEGE